MLGGRVLDLGGTVVIYEDWVLSPSEQEILEFGFSLSSVNRRVICGVVAGELCALAPAQDASVTAAIEVRRAARIGRACVVEVIAKILTCPAPSAGASIEWQGNLNGRPIVPGPSARHAQEAFLA